MVLETIIESGAKLIGGHMSNKAAKKQSSRDYERQKEFAKKSLGWKIKDAGKHGLHPLEAIGGNATAFQPLGTYGSPMGEAIADVGATVARGIASKADKANAQKLLDSQLDMNNAQIENIKAQTAAIQRESANPSFSNRPVVDQQRFTKDGKSFVVTPSGEIVYAPEGPGVDELIIGAINDACGVMKKGGKLALKRLKKIAGAIGSGIDNLDGNTMTATVGGKNLVWDPRLQLWKEK